MRVRFGLHRDALEPSLPRTAVGEITVGPQGFLGLLESDLGIAPVASHPSESVADYRECLAACDDWVRFYHRSFDVDPVGVARTLNDWRQRWYLHGWDGRFPGQVGGRLGDMAAVESLAAERVPPGVGQRLRAVLAQLDKRSTQVAEVELLDHADDLPPLWRRVLERFDCSTTPGNTPRAPRDSDLGKLQALLTRSPARPLSGDGSLVVVRAFSRDATAQATAEMLRRLDDPSQAVVVASRDGIILDNALQRVGLPRAGFQYYSPFRAASQVLKLAFALIWQPLDPHRLLQFLIHPVNPLPWRVRGRLAEAVASQPGIGGPAWQEAMAEIDHDQTAGVEFWTTPARCDAGHGVLVEDLHERASRVAAWLATRLATAEGGEENAVFSAAYSQARALASTLRRLGDGDRQRIAKIELDSLVDEATRSTPDASFVAEAGHVPATSHPGNVTEATDEVFWWDLAPQRPDLTSPWSKEERDALAAAGIDLPTPEDQLAADKRAWLRPVLNCRKRLVLVVHEDDEGRHPLWGRIREQIQRGWVDVPLDEILLRGETLLDKVAVGAPRLERKPLPKPRRWWRIDQPLPTRENESYTSLNKTCYYPHEWVLTYAARLRSGGINEVADGAMLKGRLAHRLFERFFTEHGDWRSLGDHDIQKWLVTTIRDLIEKEGAVLLENGRGVDRQQVITTMEQALARLLGHLRRANVHSVKSEQAVQRSFPGGVLYGEADLVVVGPGDSEAVLDAKWGSERYREEEIEAGRHLQLAVYGYALGEKAWPSTGYYIVTTGNVVAPDTRFFPGALAAGGEPVEAVWRRSLVTRNWRLEQFARGEIEVNADAEPDAASEPPESGLESRVEPDRFDEFRWLTGVAPFR